MTDLLVLSLTAGVTWGLWQALGEWGVTIECWLWAWGVFIVRKG